MRPVLALAMLVLLAGCGRIIPEGSLPPPTVTAPAAPLPPAVATPAAPVAANAALAGIALGPSLAALPLGEADAASALASFVESCPKLLAREDASGLTRSEDWRAACTAARGWPQARARAFFAERHAFVQLLRHAHGARCGEAEFARGFLLQGGGDEGRRRAAFAFLAGDVGDVQRAAGSGDQALPRRFRRIAVGEGELLELLSV